MRTLIETAIHNNRDLRLATLNIERMRALYQIQHTELIPRVELAGSATQRHIPGDISNSGRANTAKQYGVTLGITAWEIDFFGRIRALEQRALEEYFSTEHAQRAAQIILISEVANAYFTLIADREKLQLAQATLATQKDSYQLIKRRYEVGLITEIDLRQSETRVAAAQGDVARLNSVIAQDVNALNLLLGTIITLDGFPNKIAELNQFGTISPGTSSEILFKRPDILQAESLLKASMANIDAARRALFPRISLTSIIGGASSELSGLFQAGSFAWNYAGQISMPIFDSRANAALAATKIERELALTKYQQAIQLAFREVADALAQQETLDDQISAQQKLVNAANIVERLAVARYQKGADTYLSVLDAQRAQYGAQQQLISLQWAKFANQIRLYAVLGGGAN